MSKSTAQLLAELDAEFGSAAQKKAKRDITALRKSVTHEASSTAWTEGAVSNAVASSMRNQPGWQPTARITHLIDEHCDFCNGTVSYVGNTFTLFENRRLKAKVHAPELITHDDLGFELPHLTDQHHHTVPQCAACLRLTRKVEDLLAACFINHRPVQTEITWPQ